MLVDKFDASSGTNQINRLRDIFETPSPTFLKLVLRSPSVSCSASVGWCRRTFGVEGVIHSYWAPMAAVPVRW